MAPKSTNESSVYYAIKITIWLITDPNIKLSDSRFIRRIDDIIKVVQ